MTGDPIRVESLTLAYGENVILRDVSFSVPEQSIFFIIGESGSGKSTLFSHMIGLQRPERGHIYYRGNDFLGEDAAARERTLRRFGVLYQSGGLFTSMTLADNVALPLAMFTDLPPGEVDEIVRLKLRLVGLAGFESFYPDQLSGGMQKRAGLVRAIALDPEILYLDEPSAGLDPVASRRLDELIVALRTSLGATVVIVSHELDSILGIGDHCIYLDPATRTIGAQGPPRELLAHPPTPAVAEFMRQRRDVTS
jgi:phospholipid/cholesterol/gamma-HCH transport system ATP-binding protein